METFTWGEITCQSQAIQKSYEVMENFEVNNVNKNTIYIFTGCGTSFYLAHSAAKYFQKTTGRTSIAVPASEIFLDEESVFSTHNSYHLIAISRSGTTTEVVKALEHVKKHNNIQSLAVTCNINNQTAALSDQSIVLDFVNEKSVVMTQSFTSMLFALQLFACKVSGDQIRKEFLKQVPEKMSNILQNTDLLKPLTNDSAFKRYIFLGASVMNGLAKEATLKLKEMTQTESESYSSLEFRHGPISTVDRSTVVVLLSSDATKEYDQELVSDLQQHGAKVVVFSKSDSSIEGDIHIPILADLPSDEVMVAYMPHLQLLAYHKALALGLNPDKPRNLTQVVKLNLN